MYTEAAEQIEEAIHHFRCRGLLLENQVFALNRDLGTLSLLRCEQDGAHLCAERQFTDAEVSLLLPLLQAYPVYCPHEVLFAHLNYTNPKDTHIERCREHLLAAFEEGLWNQEMRAVRNVLSRTRLKLRVLRVDVSSLLSRGYILLPRSKESTKQGGSYEKRG